MFAKPRKWPLPPFLPHVCGQCGQRLSWEVVTWFDPNIRDEKVEYYHAKSACGAEYYFDGRGQVVAPAQPNLAPDLSDFAYSPQGQQWFPGTPGYAEAETKAAEQAKVAAGAAAKAAAAKAAAAAAAPPAAAATPVPAQPEPAAAAPTEDAPPA